MTEDGQVVVSGHAQDEGSGVATVVINGVTAELGSDGTFTATVPLSEGMTLIDSIVTDRAGNSDGDLRAILSGQMAEQGTNIEDALVAEIGPNTLDLLGTAVSDLALNTDFGAVGAAFNPLVDVGNSCAGVELDLQTVDMSDVAMSLQPTANGVDVRIVVANVDVDTRANYKIGCFGGGGSATVNLSANEFVLTGTLAASIKGSGDIAVGLSNLQTSFVGFDLDVGSIPDVIVNLFNGLAENAVKDQLSNQITALVPSQGEQFLADFVGRSYGVDVIGDTLNIDVVPTEIAMSDTGIRIRVDGKSEFSGVSGASYLVSSKPAPTTANIGNSTGGKALSVALADDVANQALAGLWASGQIEALMEPLIRGKLQDLLGDGAEEVVVTLSLPPIVTTDATTSAVHLSIGDLMVKATNSSETLVEFAISAQIDLTLEDNGQGIALVTDAANIRGKVIEKSSSITLNLGDDTVAAIAELAINEVSGQSDAILAALPLPSFGAIMASTPEVKALEGYLVLSADLTN